MNKKYIWPLVLVVVFALSRWPGLMPANFSAAYAIVFCAGLFFPPRLVWTAPLLTLFASDFLISRFYYQTDGSFSCGVFLLGIIPNYVAYAALIGLGRMFGPRQPWGLLIGGQLLGALLFYLFTNTASWLSLPYAKTVWGWIQAMTTGLPGYPPTWEFLRNTLLSGGIFGALFTGAMKLLESETAEQKEPAEESPENPEEAKV